jgi:hypothetical protein
LCCIDIFVEPPLNWRLTFAIAAALASPAVLAQSAAPSGDCHRDSVVVTRCVDDVPNAVNNTAPADAQATRDEQQKKATKEALDRQRAEASARATTSNGDELDEAQVVGHKDREKSADEIFDGYFGGPKAPTTRTSDSMGNTTECISRCTGFGCCKTVLANPSSPGMINHEP